MERGGDQSTYDAFARVFMFAHPKTKNGIDILRVVYIARAQDHYAIKGYSESSQHTLKARVIYLWRALVVDHTRHYGPIEKYSVMRRCGAFLITSFRIASENASKAS